MRSEGTGGVAVSRVNDPEFVMFATKSGRDIHSDLERAHRPVVSPIKLKPLTAAEEAALYSEHRGNGRRPSAARPTTPRKPAPPARLPAPGPGPSTVEAVGPSAPPPRAQAGRGQTTSWRRQPGKFDQAQIVADYYSGMTGRAVSKLHGCHEASITHILNTWHVVRLPRGGKLPAAKPPVVQPDPPAPSSVEVAEVITDLTNDLGPSLRTTVRRLSQAGFSQIEMAVYAGVDEQTIREALLSAGIRSPHLDHWISA